MVVVFVRLDNLRFRNDNNTTLPNVMPKAGKGKAAQKEASKKHSVPYSRDKPASGDKSTPSTPASDGKPSRKRRKTKVQDLNAEGSSSRNLTNYEVLEQEMTAPETAEAKAGSAEPQESSTQLPTDSTSAAAAATEWSESKSKKDKRRSEKSTSPEPKKKKTKHELRELQVKFEVAQATAAAAQAELQKKIAELEKTVAEQAAQLETKTTTIDNTNKVSFQYYAQ